MLSDVSYANAIPHAANMKEAIATYHPFQNYESLASLHGVVAFRFKHADETAPENITFAPLQQLAINRALIAIERAADIRKATFESERNVLIK